MVDIKPTMEKLGVKPSPYRSVPDGLYTVPVLMDETLPGPPKIISESNPIAEYLDQTYPERPIFPEGSRAVLELYRSHVVKKVFYSIVPLALLSTFDHIAKCDHAYFRESRERWLGVKLEDLCSTPAKREESVEKLKTELDGLAVALDKNGKDSVFILGNQVSSGDFVLIGAFAWLNELDHDTWELVKTWNEGRWARLWNASEEWRLNKA